MNREKDIEFKKDFYDYGVGGIQKIKEYISNLMEKRKKECDNFEQKEKNQNKGKRSNFEFPDLNELSCIYKELLNEPITKEEIENYNK